MPQVMPEEDQNNNGLESNGDTHRRSIRDIPIPAHRRREAGDTSMKVSLDGVKTSRPIRKSPAPQQIDPSTTYTPPQQAEDSQENTNEDYSFKSYYQMSEEQTYKPPRRPGKYKKIFKLGLILVAVLVIFMIATWHSASVTVVEKHSEKALDLKLSLSPESSSSATGTVAFKSVDVSDSASQTLAATGEAAIKTKSTGVITIYNTYSSADQPLVKNTRFETPDGLVFRIDQPTVVPGSKKNSDGSVVPGKVTAKVVADQPGEQYNISPVSKFTVPGFKGQPQYDGFYASSDSAMQGGFDGVQKVPDQKEETAAIDRLTQTLSGKLAEAAAASAGEDYIAFIVPGTFAVRSTSRTPSGENVTINVEASAKAVAIKKQDLTEEISVKVIPTYIRGTGGRVDDFGSIRGIPEGADVPTSLSLSGTAKVTWTVSVEEIKKALSGKSLTEVSQIAANFPGAESFTPVVRPFWRNTFPISGEKIEVVIPASEPTDN